MCAAYRAVVILCLVTVGSIARTADSEIVPEKTHCQYRNSALNSVSSKLIPNGYTFEIEGKSYHCENGSISERLEKSDIITVRFGETSSVEHHIRKRWFWIALIAAAIYTCVEFCDRKSEGSSSPTNHAPKLTCPKSGQIVYADRSEVKARHSWPDPTVTDSDGENLTQSIEQTSGQASGSYFERKTHMVSYKVLDSHRASATCDYTFTVKVISCPPIQPPPNSKVTCDSEFIYGSSCSVKCNEGYEMVPTTNNNEQVISCEKNCTAGIHSESPNTCKAIVCPEALRPTNGKAVCSSSNHTFQTVCSTKCNNGYTLLHDQHTECQSDRQWSHVLPACTDIEKPVISNCPESIHVYAERHGQPTIVSWSLPSATDSSGTVTVTQIEGQGPGSSFPEGHHKISYTASDGSGNVSPNCTFYVHVIVFTCSPPAITDRFMIFDCPDGYVYGASCTLSCMGGVYPLVGNNVITCEKNDSSSTTYWDVGSETLYCKTNPCNPLPPPGNGAISCAAWLYGQMCQMQCQEKYDIPYGTKSDDGVSDFNGQFTCSTSTGKYHPSNTVPNCTEIRNVRFSALPGEFFYYAGDCNDEETLKQIKENFISLMIQREQTGWAGVCPNTTECNVNNTEVTCGPTSGRRKRSADDTDSDFSKVSKNIHKRSLSKIQVRFFVTTTWENVIPSMETFLKMEKIQQNIFGVIEESGKNGTLNVSGLSPEMSSFSYGWSDPGCPEGSAVRWKTMTCVPCAIGTYLDKSNPSNPVCRNCPKGAFKDREDDALCTTCPSGMFTMNNGAESITECIEKCDRGEFSNNGLKPCSVCPRNSYQSKEMSISCEECPLGKSSNPGSTSVNNCSEFDIIFSKQGDTIVFDNNHINESNKFAVFAWISNANYSLTIMDGKSGTSSLNITYGKTVCAELYGYKTTLNLTTDIRGWHHLTIVINGDTATISVYINGKLDVQQNIPTLANISLSGTFVVTLNEDSPTDILITGYQVIQNIPSEDEIATQSSSCPYTRNDTVLSMGNIKWTSLDTSRIVVPSQCDNIDQCSPNPCNGHKCTDGVRSYTCHCDNGYFGENCEISTDYCRDTPCKNRGSCQNTNDTYTCLCSKMYKGNNCEIPVVNGGWSVWTEFTECSVSCNGGLRTRSRVCNNPSPDPDGLPCDSSQSTESESCNTEKCPTCPELKLSFGNVNNCSDVNGDTVCEVSCQVGYTFAPDNLPLKEYRCGQSTGYTWNGQTPACGRAKMPSTLSTESSIQYNKAIQCDKTSTALNIVQSKLEDSLSCYQHAICAVTTSIGDCQRSVSSIKITLNATLPDKDLDLKTYYSSGNLSESLQTLVTTVVELENSTMELNSTAHLLDFDIDGDTFSATETRVTGIVDCDEGQGSDAFICLDCPMGTFSTSGKCKLCEKGTYQDEIGQIMCKSCPTGLTSKFLGSQDESSCSEVTSSANNASKHITESGKTDLIVVVAGVVVAVLVLVGVISVLVYKIKSIKGLKLPSTKRKSSISIGSLLSLRKISPLFEELKVNEYKNVPPRSQRQNVSIEEL